jgi:hypothetical protein
MGGEYLLGLSLRSVIIALIVDLALLAFVVWRL